MVQPVVVLGVPVDASNEALQRPSPAVPMKTRALELGFELGVGLAKARFDLAHGSGGPVEAANNVDHLSANARQRVGFELDVAAGIELLDGVDQTDPSHIRHWCQTFAAAIRSAYPHALLVSGVSGGPVSSDSPWQPFFFGRKGDPAATSPTSRNVVGAAAISAARTA